MEASSQIQFNQADFLRTLDANLQPAIQAMQALSDACLRAGKAIHDSFYGAYLKAGAPYGETHEGFIKWLDSLAENPRRSPKTIS